MADRLARTCRPWLAAVTVVLGAVLTASAVPVWTSDWIAYNGSEYRVTGAMDWNAAQAQAQSVGANLVTINDAAEQAWIETNILDVYSISQWGIWIGLYQPAGSPEPAGGWQWVSGEPVTYTKWYTGEPNNAGGTEWAAHIFAQPHPTAAGYWNDLDPANLSVVNQVLGVVERPLAAAVPEPGSVSLLALLLAIGAARGAARRR